MGSGASWLCSFPQLLCAFARWGGPRQRGCIGLRMVAGGAPPARTAQGLQMKILGTELTLAQGLEPQTLSLCRQGCPLH